MKTKLSGIMTLFLAFVVQFTFAQERIITGVVSDETGPLPGVSVLIEGTSTGTETDFDGNYTIQANKGSNLRFSFVGMTTVVRSVASNNVINVTMVAADNTLDEVVVMGYATQKKSELTGSSVQIDSDVISQIPVASVDQVLQGKVAGLTISSTSGTPGATQNIRIRGISSITAGNEPLFVIDGVPTTNENTSGSSAVSSLSTLSSLNSNDIQSITVLKDASATAAYGARGANGVIVITTKSGKSGKTKFNFSSSVGVSNDAIDGPTMLTAAEQETLTYEAVFNTYGESYDFSRDEAKGFYENYISDTWSVWNENGRKEGDWADAITVKDALQQEYNLSATGGDETSNYYAALGYYDSQATVIGSDFNRISAALRFSTKLTDKIKFETRNTVANTKQNGILESSAYFASPRTAKYFMTPRAQPYNADGTINIDDIRAATNVRNPLWIAKNDIHENKLTRIISNNSLKWDTPIENLSFKTLFSIDYQVFDYKEYQNRVHGDGQDVGGYAARENNNTVNYVFQNSLNYILYLGDDHTFNFSAIQEFQKNNFNYLYADGESFAADGLTNLASAGKPTSASSYFTDWSIASYLGMFNYSFRGKYILNATYRREGNSRFPAENRWGDFWSVGAAWNLANENFMGNINWVSNFKLRASYGVTGNAAISINTYQSLFSYDADYAGAAAIYPSNYGNPNLTWETQNTLDAGVDFGFVDNRISGTFSYYTRESTDLLQKVPLSRTTGFSSQNTNVGSMENSGIELELNFDIVRSEDFNLSLGGYFSTNDNEVTKLALDGEGEPITITTGTRKVDVGHTVYEWYMRKFAGVDTNTGENLYYLNGIDGATTANYNEAERAFQGKGALPTLTAGGNFHVDIKGFFLDATAYYAGGHKVYEDWTRYIHGNDRFNFEWYNSINTLNDRWQKPGDVTDVAKVTYTAEPWRTHSKYLHDGDFIRLKDVTFGYDLKPEWTNQIGLNSARIFVRGTNLYTWVKDDNLLYDPEMGASGFSGLRTPPVKTISFGININF